MISRLKSLELHGYKTFASKINFEFPGKVTAIVGPNGSGKSNIADAIRWVLGEQSYSLLRGRKTEDMIFSGSEQRPRASMASAAITFDNEDGWLPIDFSEVSIARRAYRDGQNEYVLNGQRVRLKETSELLAQSGLAERTYTIIGQGLVDAALSLKPEERRRFFEEAAGIGLFRARREESLNRLDATRRNLERVHDILGELEPRLRSLEKQAARVVEYERIKADLQILLREWYGYHWHHTQQDIAHAREVLNAQQSRLDAAQHRLDEVDGRAKSVRETVQALRNQLNEWHAQSAGLHNQREQVNRSLAVLDERNRSLLEQEKMLTGDLVRLQEEEKVQHERLVQMESEQALVNKDYEEAKSFLLAARKNLAEREGERSRKETNLRDLRKEMVRVETRQVESRAHLKELSVRLEGLRKNLASLEEKQIEVEQALVEASKLHQNVLAEQKQAEDQLHLLENEVHEAENQSNKAELQQKRAQDHLTELMTEKSRLQAQLSVLEQAEKSLTGLNLGAQAILKAAKQGKISGDYVALSSQIEVSEEYETAIAALLGENLDGIILPGKTDPEPVLSLMANGEQGRAILYPFDWLRGRNTLKAPDDEDCYGRAADLVKAPESMRVLLDTLLGNALVVRDRQAARRISREQPEHVQVVTTRGEVYYGNGSVRVGKEPREGLIARPRQIHEMHSKLAELDVKVEEARRECDAHSQNIETTRKYLFEKSANLREASQQLSQAGRAVQHATLALEQARQKKEWQINQLNSINDQITSGQADHSSTGTEIKKDEGQIESIDLQINEVQRELDQLPIDDLQAEVLHWNTQTAVTVRSVQDADRRLKEYQHSFTSNQERQKSVQQRIHQISQLLVDLEGEKSRLHESEASLNISIDDFQQKITPAEQELTGLDKKYDKIQSDYSAVQQGVTAAERSHAQAQLELSRYRETLDSLRRRIEDDFGLVAFEYASDISGPNPLPLDGMVQQLPAVVEIPSDLDDSINRQRGQLRRMGAINPEAQTEYRSVKERRDFLVSQVADLHKADEDLRQVIAELDELMKREFRKTFEAVAVEFREMFTRLFGGGHARLILQDEDDPTETGIDIEARLPGRREQGLSLLSGGERSLTAVALIFSLLKVSPTPFCVLDEVDAMLDEANVGRFTELLNELSQNTQFIVITHNRNTVQVADVIYGVTMGKDSASQVISLKLDEVGEELVR